MSSYKKVTLSLPEALLRRFRVYAAERNESMSHLMSEAIQALVDQDKRAASAKKRFLSRIQNSPDRGTNGTIRWSREELHER